MEILPENRDLLGAFRRAETGALEIIYRAYVERVAAMLRRGFEFSSRGQQMRFSGYRDPDDLQDALQETFLSAFSVGARKGYNGLTPFSAYLMAIAHNVVLQRFRKDLSRLRCFTELAAAEPEQSDQGSIAGGAAPAPDEAAGLGELRRLVRAFVASLTEEQRRIVRLYFIERLSQEATAESLALNRNRVRKQILTIRKKLFKRLRREGLDAALPFSLDTVEVEP